jgi:arabinogalactan oligomer/maltooligosaccharide transport system permease protein
MERAMNPSNIMKSQAEAVAPPQARPVAAPTARTKAAKAPRLPEILGDIATQIALIFITLVVLFPTLWIVGMALDPRDLARPDSIVPPQVSLEAFGRVFTKTFINDITVWIGLRNSLIVAVGTALFATIIGTLAAYAFSRFRFPGRQAGMLAFIIVQIMPAVTTLAPLFVILNAVRVPPGCTGGGDCWVLRENLPGLIIAYSSSALPFVIWNLKGYFDTIPKDLEEAALIDGAGPFQAFLKVVLPLSLPAFAVTLLFAFMAGWSEYLLAVIFINDAQNTTLPMMLAGMVNQYGDATWSDFAALSIVMSLPVVLLFFLLQRWIVSGLTLGGVKG